MNCVVRTLPTIVFVCLLVLLVLGSFEWYYCFRVSLLTASEALRSRCHQFQLKRQEILVLAVAIFSRSDRVVRTRSSN